MRHPTRPPLPDWIEGGYEVLEAHIDGPRDGFTRATAIELLEADESFPDERADAEYALQRLLERGWLYDAGEELRVTELEG